MSTINIFQISLEIWGIVLSLILAVFSGVTVYRSGRMLKNAWTLLLLNCMLLSCDALAYVYRGDPSSIGIAMTRFSNFGVFFIEGVLVWWFAYIVQQIIVGKDKISMKSAPMVITSVCVIAQLLGTVLTPFTGFYYSFDEQNYYVRGNGIILSFLLMGTVLAINIFEVIRNKQKISERLLRTFIGMAFILVASVVFQFIFYGISLINIAITLAIIVMFLNLLTDNREREFKRHISGMEDIIKELSNAKSKEDSQ